MLIYRTDLQHGQGPTRRRYIYEDTKNKFNDWSCNSGGLIKDREEYRDAEIDPEEPNTTGLITEG
jgi:hypothetical protein